MTNQSLVWIKINSG